MPACRACSGESAEYLRSTSTRLRSSFRVRGRAKSRSNVKLRYRVEAFGGARVPGYEDEFVIGRALRIPLQVFLALDGLAVLVHAEQRHIEIVAREGEIVRVAAEIGGLLLRREDDADVGVLLIAVEPVLAALVERDHFGAEPRLLLAFPLDAGDGGLAGRERLLDGLRPA